MEKYGLLGGRLNIAWLRCLMTDFLPKFGLIIFFQLLIIAKFDPANGGHIRLVLRYACRDILVGVALQHLGACYARFSWQIHKKFRP